MLMLFESKRQIQLDRLREMCQLLFAWKFASKMQITLQTKNSFLWKFNKNQKN